MCVTEMESHSMHFLCGLCELWNAPCVFDSITDFFTCVSTTSWFLTYSIVFQLVIYLRNFIMSVSFCIVSEIESLDVAFCCYFFKFALFRRRYTNRHSVFIVCAQFSFVSLFLFLYFSFFITKKFLQCPFLCLFLKIKKERKEK